MSIDIDPEYTPDEEPGKVKELRQSLVSETDTNNENVIL